MNNQFIIKKANHDIIKELASIGFDSNYSGVAADKYECISIKIFKLKAPEANILKQLCLSLGFDCAVNRDTITCKCEYTDCLISASKSQLNKLIKKLAVQPFRLKTLGKNISDIIKDNSEQLEIRNSIFGSNQSYIMGILNVTPDSFSDGGQFLNIEQAIRKVSELITDGADIIDIGGESTRPSAEPVSQEEEIKRILPVLKEIRKINPDIPISVDTRNYLTAKTAIENGADIINDVTGLSYDSQLSDYICSNNIPVIIMHSDKIPGETPLEDKEYDVIEEIYKSLHEKIEYLTSKGLKKHNIIIDPGIGFGKSINENFEIIKRIDEFKTLNCKILVGISRKSFIKNSFKLSELEELDDATAVYDSYLMSKGVNFIRVHNVKNNSKQAEYLSKLI